MTPGSSQQFSHNILHLIYTEGISGAEKHVAQLLPALQKENILCELLIVCPAHAKALLETFAEEIRGTGVKVTILLARRSLRLSTLKKINRYLRDNNISYVHSHLLRSDLIISLVKKFFFPGLFIISTKHGYREKVMCEYIYDSFKIKKDAVYYATAFSLKMIDRNIAVSAYIAELFHALRLTDKDMPVIHNGIDIPRGESAKPDRSISSPAMIIVGRLEELKGHRFVFDVMPAVLEKYPDCKLMLVGDGSIKAELVKRAQELDIAHAVTFTGFVKNPYSLIAAADLIIIPSLAEAFGLVFTEAMALQIPIVAFDVPAGNEIIKNDETGSLVPVHNKQALTQKILELLADKNERERLAQNAYADYQKNYTVKAMTDKTISFYHSLF